MRMNFIETLKSVGGVKPCLICGGKGSIHAIEPIEVDIDSCRNCHGTGQILDLAPLLASGRYLLNQVGDLVEKLIEADNNAESWHYPPGPTHNNLHVVGPQRAAFLIYEVACQLGGTAVVAEPEYGIKEVSRKEEHIALQVDFDRGYTIIQSGYHLSIPIPPDATCLFVTDKMDEKEMTAVVEATVCGPCGPHGNALPYMLCLVSSLNELHVTRKGPGWAMPSDPFKVISLHQEQA